VSSGNPTQYAHAVADLYLATKTAPATTAPASADGAPAPAGSTNGGADAVAGMYRRSDTGEPATFTRAGADLRTQGGGTLTPRSATRYTSANGQTYDFGSNGRLTVVDEFGTVQTYARVTGAELTPRSFADYAGEYASDDAEVSMTAAVQGGALVLRRRPDTVMTLTPLYVDAFRAPIGFVRFHRDAAGKVTSFSVTQERVWELRFKKN
jgi:hypothetical protein